MNYLAHTFIARHDAAWLTGSFIADAFKGSSYNQLPSGIMQGVVLHRAVDTFTDTHPVIRYITKRISPALHKYAAVAVDIYGDHYLAQRFTDYAPMSLVVFEQQCGAALKEHITYIPERYIGMVDAICTKGMMQGYADIDALHFVFNRLQKRVQYANNLDQAVQVLTQERDFIFGQFDVFFPELLHYTETYIAAHLSDN